MSLIAESTLSDAEFRQISDLVYKHCGINLHDGKKELVQARVMKRLRACKCESFSAYLKFLESPNVGEEFSTLIDTISTNLTSFFREQNHFHYLIERFLPKMTDQKRSARTNRVRAWSAGCSTGEEPYTLAMTLNEELRPPEWDVKVLATDISTRVLRAATAGVYDKDRLNTVPAAMRTKYFAAAPGDKDSVRVSDDIRKLISFRYLNLMESWPFSGPFDFIFCRNVMIYFDKPTQQKLVQRFHDCLADGGVLFTGHSESLTGINHKFRYVEPTIYAKA